VAPAACFVGDLVSDGSGARHRFAAKREPGTGSAFWSRDVGPEPEPESGTDTGTDADADTDMDGAGDSNPGAGGGVISTETGTESCFFS